MWLHCDCRASSLSKQQAVVGSIAQLQKALLLVDGKCEGLAADVARGGSSGAGSWDIKAGRG